MALDFDDIIDAGITEGRTLQQDETPLSNRQLFLIAELKEYAKVLLIGLGKMRNRPGSKFHFDEVELGHNEDFDRNSNTPPTWVPDGLALITNIKITMEVPESPEDHFVRVGECRLDETYTVEKQGNISIRVTPEEMVLSLYDYTVEDCPRNLLDIEVIPTPTIEAREAATATLLKKTAVLAAQNNKFD